MLKSKTNLLFIINLLLIIATTILDEYVSFIRLPDLFYSAITIICIILGFSGLIIGIIELRERVKFSLIGLLGNLSMCIGFIYFSYKAFELVKNQI